MCHFCSKEYANKYTKAAKAHEQMCPVEEAKNKSWEIIEKNKVPACAFMNI